MFMIYRLLETNPFFFRYYLFESQIGFAHAQDAYDYIRHLGYSEADVWGLFGVFNFDGPFPRTYIYWND